MNIWGYLKTRWNLFAICSVALMFVNSSCTRIRHKIVDTLTDCEVETAYHIGSLYPELNNVSCSGIRREGFLSCYWFKYEATPAMVEATLMGHSCAYEEIVPDTVLCLCGRDYALKNFKLTSADYKSVYAEWQQAPQNNLLYYCCTRTPFEHVLVFDTVMGSVYHYISEFRE